MNERDALLAAIVADPDDDAVRLVFADWCEEHGDAARAEFIRGQFELEGMDVGDPRRAEREDALDDLLAEHEREWLGPAEKLYSWEWRRGFVEEVGVQSLGSLESARPQFERHPVRRAGFSTSDMTPVEMIRSPFLERMRSMTFGVGETPADRGTLLELLASPRLARLTDLDVAMGGGRARSAGLLADLAGMPHVPPLRSIRVNRITEADARAAMESANLAGLADVAGFDGVNVEALRTLLQVPERWLGLGLGFETLPGLDLDRLADCGRLTRLGFRWPRDRAAVSLPASLERLSIESVMDQGPIPGTVARSLNGTRLHRLEYRWEPHNDLTGPELWAGLGDLLEALPGPVLDLTFSEFPDDPLPHLVRLPGLSKIRRLELNCEGSDDGVDALAACGELTGLQSLEVATAWSSEQVRRFATAPLLGRLRELSFQRLTVGDAGAIALLESPWLRRLWKLEMNRAGLGWATAEALTAWPGLGRLRRLMLTFNKLPHEAMKPLRSRLGCRLAY